MQRLIDISERKAKEVDQTLTRYLIQEIDWKQKLIIILGQRGTGKTTMILQKMKSSNQNAIYLSLDDIYFELNRLVLLVDELYKKGFRRFYLDEVHRYSHWSKDLKNIYDSYSDIFIVATGSSMIEVSDGQADLSRRSVIYNLPGLSFREFLIFRYSIQVSPITLPAILNEHHKLAAGYNDLADIKKTFDEYLRIGYFPLFLEGNEVYLQKIQSIVDLILKVDLVAVEDINFHTLKNIKKLLYVISQSVPFTPNISELARKINIPRNSILRILDLLNQAKLISLLNRSTKGMSYLQKPEKIYIQNPNYIYALSDDQPDLGNLRETFFYSQLAVHHQVTAPKFGDFLIDQKYVFEIGGPSKTKKQIIGVPNAYIAADGIKGGSGNKIPLWLFGFLY